MSFDLKIQNSCDHKINWEVEAIDDDRRQVSLNYPVGSVSSFMLRIDNVDIDSSNYQVLKSTSEITIQPTNYVLLNERIKNYNPFIEATYTTLSSYCPKCSGIKYLNDIKYDLNGDVIKARDEYLLVQTVEKYIVTELGSNTFHTWLGTSLHSLIGSKIFDFNLIKTKILTQINTTINNLKRIQDQVVGLGIPLTQGELFDKLISVNVSQDTADPTIIMILVEFNAKSGKPLEYTQYMELNPFVLQKTR